MSVTCSARVPLVPAKGRPQNSPRGRERRRFQRRVAVGLSFQSGGGEKLFGPSELCSPLLSRRKEIDGATSVRCSRQ